MTELMKLKQWVEKDEFENLVRSSKEPIIVLFAADWCGYCTRFLSTISGYEIRADSLNLSQHVVYVVNIDSVDESMWDTYNVNLVPTLVVFSQGKPVFRRDGRALVGLKQTDLDDAIKTVGTLLPKKFD